MARGLRANRLSCVILSCALLYKMAYCVHHTGAEPCTRPHYLSTSFCFACAVLFLSILLAFLTSTASSRSRSFRARSLDDAASPSALKSICVRPGRDAQQYIKPVQHDTPCRLNAMTRVVREHENENVPGKPST